MKRAYQVFAFLIALEVLVQATTIAWGMFGFGRWIEDGNVFNEQILDDRDTFHFYEARGFMIHGINGFMIVPALSLIFLILSFFAKIPGGIKWAAIVFVLVVLQSQVLPPLGKEYPVFGALHGLNALLIFGAAVMAGKRVKSATTQEAAEPVTV